MCLLLSRKLGDRQHLHSWLTATPQTVHTTGVKSFCSIEDNVVRYDPTGVTATYGNCSALTAIGQ